MTIHFVNSSPISSLISHYFWNGKWKITWLCTWLTFIICPWAIPSVQSQSTTCSLRCNLQTTWLMGIPLERNYIYETEIGFEWTKFGNRKSLIWTPVSRVLSFEPWNITLKDIRILKIKHIDAFRVTKCRYYLIEYFFLVSRIDLRKSYS